MKYLWNLAYIIACYLVQPASESESPAFFQYMKKVRQGKQIGIFLGILCLLSGLTGFLVWLLLPFEALRSVTWCICFIGYPIMLIGLLGGSLFCFRHAYGDE